MSAAVPKRSFHTLFEWSWRALICLVAIGLLIVITTHWKNYEGRAGWQGSDDAYLEADQTPIAAHIPGYIQSVPVQDYQKVKAGDLLAVIVQDDYRAAVDQAKAGVASAIANTNALKAQRPLLRANLAAARAVIASTTANAEQNRRDLARQVQLFTGGSSTTEAGEKLRTVRDQLSAQVKQNTAQADAIARQLDVLTAQQEQAQAAVAAAKATLETAQINYNYTRITAPQDGVVGQRQVRPGQFIAAGGQVISLIPLPNLWVIANFKETQLTHMAVGQEAKITVDSFPGRTLTGHVSGFSPGSGSTFALLPPDNATGNFTKVVQRIGVKILIDDPNGLGEKLRAGMSVVVKVNARAHL